MHATTRDQVVEKQADRNTAVRLIDVNVFSGRLENASTPVGNKRRSSAAPAVTIVASIISRLWLSRLRLLYRPTATSTAKIARLPAEPQEIPTGAEALEPDRVSRRRPRQRFPRRASLPPATVRYASAVAVLVLPRNAIYIVGRALRDTNCAGRREAH